MLSKLNKQVGKKKRIGRGISAGQGKTAGRGTKGQNSRTGGGVRPGFEGGQLPLTQRLPKKRGFTARTQKPATLTLSKLSSLKDGEKVTLELLKKLGLVSNRAASVKVVDSEGTLKKITITVPITKTAAAKVVKAGGKIEIK